MIKLKKFWVGKNLFNRLKALKPAWLFKAVVVSGTVTILMLIYFLIAGLAVTEAETRLVSLKNSWEKEKICHEDCATWREETEKIVIRALAAGNKRVADRLEKYFENKLIGTEFKSELIVIARRAYGPDKPPAYLRDYMDNPAGDAGIQALIINFYSASSLNKDFKADAPLDYYFNILRGNTDWVVQQAAINVLSNYQEKTKYFSAGQLALIRNLVLDMATARHLRESLTLLLSDYYPLFPKETAAILDALYEDGLNGPSQFNDEVSRAFSADILNLFAGRKLPIPPVSQAAWDEYYNN